MLSLQFAISNKLLGDAGLLLLDHTLNNKNLSDSVTVGKESSV